MAMKTYNVYIINRTLAFFLFLVFVLLFLFLCVLVLNEYVKNDDVVVLLTVLVPIPLGMLANSFARYFAASKTAVRIENDKVHITWLGGGLVTNKPDAIIDLSTVSSYDVGVSDAQYKLLKIDLYDHRTFRIRGGILPFSDLREFDELACKIIEAVKKEPPYIVYSIEDIPGKVKICKARKGSGLPAIFGVIVSIFNFALVLGSFFYFLDEGSKLSAFLAASEIVGVFWFMIVLLNKKLDVEIHTDKVVITEKRHLLKKENIKEFFYKDVSSIIVTGKRRGNVLIDIRMKYIKRYTVIDYLPLFYKGGSSDFQVFEYLSNAFNAYVSANKTGGVIKDIRGWRDTQAV